MAQSLEQFTKNLLASGLPFAAEFEAFLRTMPSEKRPADGEQCARLLVREKKLTAYQAQEIYAKRGNKLVLGNYIILDKLGQGGMGMVLRAEHKRMGRQVALKVMSAAGMQNADAVKRFQREVQAAAKLSHQNVVAAFDADEAAGQHFLVMEYVEGADLSQLVKKSGPMSVEKALHCIVQAARGLEFAHQKGVVHRDIKPANLLLDGEGTVKILDMGLARLEHSAEQAELTGTGQIMGTVDYMAPEQAMSTRSADARADIYSLGITLWYLLTGRVAYDGETLMAKLMAHSSGPIPSLAAVNPNVPPALENVFRRMVAKTPAERYQSMTEVIAALEKCRAGKADVAPTVNLPSEDSKLSEFLHNIGGKSPSRSGIGSSGAAPAAAPAAPAAVATVATGSNPALEQTIVTSGTQTDTDPQTQNLTRAEPLLAAGPAKPAKPWHADWRVWAIGSGSFGGVLLLGLVIFLLTRGGPTPGPVAQSGPGKKGTPAKQELPLPAPGSGLPVPQPAPMPTPPSVPAAAMGDYALEFDGQGSHVKVPTLTHDLTQPLTIEATVTAVGPPGVNQVLVSSLRGAGGPDGASLFLQGGKSPAFGVKASSWQQFVGQPLGTGTRRLAAVWDGKELRLFVDGKLAVKQPLVRDASAARQSSPFTIGAEENLGGGAGYPFTGRLDEIRISRVARYTADYEPGPRLTADADTLALYHCDEGQGEVLKDSSGNGREGKLSGARWVAAEPLAERTNFALEFDGQNHHADIPSLSYDATKPITVEALLIPAAGSGNAVALHGADQTVQLYLQNGLWHGARVTEAENAFALSSSATEAGRAEHVAFVWDGRESRLYVNGRRVGTAKTGQGASRAKAGAVLGGVRAAGSPPPSPTYLFQGRLDEVRISNTARYDKDFMPPGPADRFTADADTLALYHFDEGTGDVLKDSSGNNHHGKIVGAKWVSVASSERQTPAAWLQFDGKENLVQIPTLLPLDTPDVVTIEVWARPKQLRGPTGQVIYWPGAHSTSLILFSQDLWQAWRRDNDAFVAVEPGSTKAEVGTWQHLAAVCDRRQLRFFIDGKLQPRVSESVNGPQPGKWLSLGGSPKADNGGYDVCFDGDIGPVRISRGARYDQDFVPAVRFSPDENALAIYNFDEGVGDVLKDSSGNNHHGKIVGAKWVQATASPPAAGP